jgi:hypothetical protein
MYLGGKASVATIELQNFTKSRRETPRARNAAGIARVPEFIAVLHSPPGPRLSHVPEALANVTEIG